MPQSHRTPGPRTGGSRADHGLFWKQNHTSTHGARTGPMRRRTNFGSPYGARRVLSMHYKFMGPYG